jgi:23S rRNA (uracil1939-C5)-methyltransferase
LTVLACELQARCPGCPLGALPYADALESKGQAARAALTPYADLSPALFPPRAAAPVHAYRLRAKLVCKGTSLGLFERGSHRVLDVTGCRVLSASVTAATAALRRLLPLPIYGADLRETSQGVLVTLLSESVSARSALERAARTLVESGGALSVALSFRRPGDVRLLAGTPEVVLGPSEARHELSRGAPYGYATHGGFVQAHAPQAGYVYAELARGLREKLGGASAPRVLELFAGNGSLALALSAGGAQVTAVESFAPAIGLAERAAREQGLRLRAVAGDATRFVAELPSDAFDAVVVNPPRRGLDVALRLALGRATPRALAYVSCNPHTLARDAWHLSRLGLRLARAEPLDMIPWSDAVEVLAWFEPAAPPAPRVLFEDEAWVAVEKTAYESAASLALRVRRLPGCRDARALDAWGEDVSGVCWLAKGSGAATPGERELTLACRGNQRKQGTISRGASSPGTRYRKQKELGRHSLVSAFVVDRDEAALLRDFAAIRHPVLGTASGDAVTNDFLQHRHGLDRAFLHVARSQLRLASGLSVEACSALPPDLSRVVESVALD